MEIYKGYIEKERGLYYCRLSNGKYGVGDSHDEALANAIKRSSL